MGDDKVELFGHNKRHHFWGKLNTGYSHMSYKLPRAVMEGLWFYFILFCTDRTRVVCSKDINKLLCIPTYSWVKCETICTTAAVLRQRCRCLQALIKWKSTLKSDQNVSTTICGTVLTRQIRINKLLLLKVLLQATEWSVAAVIIWKKEEKNTYF